MGSEGRSSGILAHLTSLPGPDGSGDLGPDAHRFARLLAEMRQSWWQMLPVGPTGYGNSPYQSPSTFAGNPLLIGLDPLEEEGLLELPPGRPDFPPHRIDFTRMIAWRERLLSQVAADFPARADADALDALASFAATHGPVWLDDFALYTAIKRHNRLAPWWQWEPALARREEAALEQAREAYAGTIEAVRVEQFLFDRQFGRLREECRELGVGLIGDIPIFVAHDSADVWADQELFHLDRRGQPTVVAGVPPDYFSATGQRWGNPLYRWERHRADGFRWWTARLERLFSLFDLVRIDHFRAFAAYWAIPADQPTAVVGEWREGPGDELFEVLRERFGTLPVIAEDLGIITEEVEELRDRQGLPGMKVLQFGFAEETTHSPDQFPENAVAYTGTHDNDTVVGWWNDPGREDEHRVARKMLRTHGTDIHWKMVEAVMESAARWAIFPMQDLLGLGSEARMNTPGTDAENWDWRFTWDQVTGEVVSRMRSLSEATGRG